MLQQFYSIIRSISFYIIPLLFVNITSFILKRIFPFLTLLVLFSSCSSESKPVTFETLSVEESFDAEISATYSKATGNSDLSKAINSNIDNAIIKYLNSSENKTDLKSILLDFNQEYLDFKTEFPDESEVVWELNIETELTYQSENVITIAISTYEFKGGAHGNDKIEFLNLNATTGKVLSLDDIISKKEAFKKLAETHFIKSLETNESKLKMEDFFFGKPFQLPENIGYSDDGLVLLYNSYEVATFNQGYTEFVIPFEDVDSLLKVH